MKYIFAFIAICFLDISITYSQVKIPIKKNEKVVKSPTVIEGIEIKNLEKVTSKDVSKLKLSTISISDAQKNAKTISSWQISPMQPKYSSLELDHFYGEFFLNGWQLMPRPMFEGPDFNDYALSALDLNFRVSAGETYMIVVKLKRATNWYDGKYIFAAAANNTFAKYPIDAANNQILIPFSANASGNRKISIGNIITSNNTLESYTIEKVIINKISQLLKHTCIETQNNFQNVFFRIHSTTPFETLTSFIAEIRR